MIKNIFTNTNLTERLKDNIILQAKTYLNEADEFYPFASVIDINGKLIPTSVYFGEEHPLTEDVLKKLEIALKKGVDEKRYAAVAIGVDVLTIPPGRQEKMDAIEIRIDTGDSGNINFYLPYEKLKSGEYKFYEVFSNTGTLSLL